VVFVAGLGKRFNLQDARNALQLHAEAGMRFVLSSAGKSARRA
jgi:hypothetical protein